MPFNKVCVERLYQKTGIPNEKKARRVHRMEDDIFADLVTSSACREENVQKRKVALTRSRSPELKKVLVVLILTSCLVMACAEKPMGR